MRAGCGTCSMARTIGRVRGAADNSYTAGVVCEKVARYAERVHHPDRLKHPLRRKGAKGGGAWQRISWEDALDEIAENLTRAEAAPRQRSRVALLLRRHHGPRDARWAAPAAPREALFRHVRHHLRHRCLARLHRRHRQADGPRPARDGAVRPHRHLGHQPGPHPGQRHDPCEPGEKGARGKARRGRCLRDGDHEAGRYGARSSAPAPTGRSPAP